jgi:hypothetical protein
MATWIWILIAIAAVVVIALLALGAMRRRTSMLRRRFGPEYDRTVEAREDRRAAEAELRAREKQRAQFTIKPLPEATRLRFAGEWRDVQERFVDQPSQAVAAADTLITLVMQERGYPTAQFEAQADVVSVDHPDMVENYRFGHAVWQRSQTEQTSTEDLREALLRYRSLFDELLRPDASEPAATSTGQAGLGEQTPGPAADGTDTTGPGPMDGTDTTAAGPMEGAAASAPDAGAPETGDPAYQDQPARGGRS